MLTPNKPLRSYTVSEYSALAPEDKKEFPKMNKLYPGRNYSGLSVSEFIGQNKLTSAQIATLVALRESGDLY